MDGGCHAARPAAGWCAVVHACVQALVKGNAPPPDLKRRGLGNKPTAGNMEEARERGRAKVSHHHHIHHITTPLHS